MNLIVLSFENYIYDFVVIGGGFGGFVCFKVMLWSYDFFQLQEMNDRKNYSFWCLKLE